MGSMDTSPDRATGSSLFNQIDRINLYNLFLVPHAYPRTYDRLADSLL
jgi:hypothetical protein